LSIQGYTLGIDKVKVYDLAGRLISEIEIPAQDAVMASMDSETNEMEITVDLSNLSSGLYLLNVSDELTERLLILK